MAPLFCFASDTKFSFSVVPLSEVLRIYYTEISKSPYIICNEVVSDMRAVSIRASGLSKDDKSIRILLQSSGYNISKIDGVDVICKIKDSEQKMDGHLFVYSPKFRSASYLIGFLSPLVQGKFSNGVASSNPTSVGDAPNTGGSLFPAKNDDLLIFEGSPSQIDKVKVLVEHLDKRSLEVIVKSHIYEVTTTKKDQSALALFGSILANKLTLGIGSTSSVANTLKIQSGGLSAVVGALSGNDNFKLLSSPFVRTKSGSSASLTVGQEVPVLDAIVMNQGQSSQSVKYVNSGVIFVVSPVVRDNFIEVDINQTISDFQKTTTGLTSSPTLNKRELKTTVSMNAGEVLVMGGLRLEKHQKIKSNFFFVPITDSDDTDNTEIIMLLEIDRG